MKKQYILKGFDMTNIKLKMHICDQPEEKFWVSKINYKNKQ